ncbi:MAG: cellulase family glycosylhydrolase [Spirochaetes bacterium]|nr:cellulase family glycosylhydrolase [Spirochaetota bacterium]
MMTRGFNTGGAALQRQTFEDAALWGANNMRVHLKPISKIPAGDYWKAFEQVENDAEKVVSNARGTGIKVILTLGSFIPGVNRDKNEYWTHPDLEQYHVEAWRRIAKRVYPYRDSVYGYDLMNEPLDRSVAPRSPAQWRELAIKITSAIREIDKDTWIIYEPGPGGTFAGFFDLEPLPDTKVIYSGHYYFPHMFTHQGIWNVKNTELTQAMTKVNIPYPLPVEDLKRDTWELSYHRLPDLNVFDKETIAKIAAPAIAFQKKYNVPIYLGEFSVIRWAPKEAGLRYLNDLIEFWESQGWSWSYHAFREYNGWSLEYADAMDWIEGMPVPPMATYLTDRAKLVLGYLKRNELPKQNIGAIETFIAEKAAANRKNESGEYAFSFATKADTSVWSATSSTTMSVKGEGTSAVLEITGTTWDSKIYRGVKLQTGTYRLSVEAGGLLTVYINKSGNWKSQDNALKWNNTPMTKADKVFTVDGGAYTIVAHIAGATGTASLRSITLSKQDK